MRHLCCAFFCSRLRVDIDQIGPDGGCVCERACVDSRLVEGRDDDNDAGVQTPTEVLVVGATGSVGARLAAALVQDGTRVRVVHRNPHAAANLRQAGFEPHAGHLGDPESLRGAAEGCQVLFHCAGEACLRADATALSWVHVAGTENVITAARAAGVARVVMLSCADVRLQNSDRIHIREDQPQNKAPLGGWARSKLLAEEMALQASCAELEVTALRPAFLWGRGDFTNLPALCREGLSGGIRVFGSGSSLFSVSHIDNVVHALRLAAAAPAVVGKAIHVTDGQYETAYEFFVALSQALNLPKPRRAWGAISRASARLRDALHLGAPDDPGLGDVVRRGRGCLLDMQRAINELHYAPIITRSDAMADLAAFVEEQGGVSALAKHRRKVAGRDEVAAFQRFTAD